MKEKLMALEQLNAASQCLISTATFLSFGRQALSSFSMRVDNHNNL